jgi:hypothetical protein
MKWAGHLAKTETIINDYNMTIRSLKRRHNLEDRERDSQGRGVHVTGVSAAYTFKLNKNILSE